MADLLPSLSFLEMMAAPITRSAPIGIALLSMWILGGVLLSRPRAIVLLCAALLAAAWTYWARIIYSAGV